VVEARACPAQATWLIAKQGLTCYCASELEFIFQPDFTSAFVSGYRLQPAITGLIITSCSRPAMRRSCAIHNGMSAARAGGEQ
jgi:hypothetical protein